MNITDYGFTPDMMPADEAGIPARITAAYRERYAFVCDRGPGYGRLKKSAYYSGDELTPTAGDFVRIDWQDSGDSRILGTLKRRTCFARLDPSSSGQREQLVAANFDYVFVLQSLNQDFNMRRLERYLTLAWQSGAEPVVILTKTDIAEQYSDRLYQAEQTAVGAEVFAVSAKTGEGLGRLERYLKPGKTLVFLGSSGVGKSSLVNALAGEEMMPTGENRASDDRGRHTTTHRQLVVLPTGVMVIDTPGMRELGMWDVSEGLGQSFADIEQYLGKCRFSDCRHVNEPGCAILEAIANGALSEARWNSYRQLKAEARFTEHKSEALQEKQRKNKMIAKRRKQIKKNWRDQST